MFIEGPKIVAECKICRWSNMKEMECRRNPPPFGKILEKYWCGKFAPTLNYCPQGDSMIMNIQMPGEDKK